MLRRLAHIGERFGADERGAATLLTAMILVVSIGIAAVCMDGGNYFYLRRVQRSASDLAALSAAANLPQAQSLAGTSSAMNGYGASALTAVELGTYTYNASLPPAARFSASSTDANAVRVTLQSRPPFIFGGVLAMLTGGTGSGVNGVPGSDKSCRDQSGQRELLHRFGLGPAEWRDRERHSGKFARVAAFVEPDGLAGPGVCQC